MCREDEGLMRQIALMRHVGCTGVHEADSLSMHVLHSVRQRALHAHSNNHAWRCM